MAVGIRGGIHVARARQAPAVFLESIPTALSRVRRYTRTRVTSTVPVCLYLRISLSSAVCGMATLRSGTCGCRHAAVEPRKGRSERLQEEGGGADRPLVLVELKDC
jgi:hypothetical protein